MATDENSWRNTTFRQSMVAKIEEAIQTNGVSFTKNSSEMETQVFVKARTRDEYLSYVARLILHVRELNKKGAGNVGPVQGVPGAQDPIGALQTLTRQGTGNNPQMVGMSSGPAGPGPNQGMMPQPPPNTATNLLQSLNQRPNQQQQQGPPPGMMMPGMQNMSSMQQQNKMTGMGGMMGGGGGQAGGGGPMNHMGPMQGMPGNQMMPQMAQMQQGNMGRPMPQMSPNQMAGPMGNAQMGPGQMPPNIQSQISNAMQNQMNNQMGGGMNAGLQGSMQQQMGPGPVVGNQMQQQMVHMQRKQNEMVNSPFSGQRNVTPNQFLRQSPSPSASSPGGLTAPTPSNQMVPSPALAPSPGSHSVMLGGAQRSVGMTPSPSSCLNTPVGIGATHSPMQDDQAYKDKVLKLSKYIEPLKKAIREKTGENERNLDKSRKMKMLLEILLNPTKRAWPMEMLMKCEKSLEAYFKRGDGSVGPTLTTLKENHFFTPLLEAVSTHLQSPAANHTLQRTFGPCLEALFGPEIRNLPPPLKKQRVEEPCNDIPDVLQGEIARLDQRFKVSLDPAQQSGSQCVQLICWLDDRHLPCVPPVSVTVPADYPQTPPLCVMASHEYATPFLSAVQKALNARITKLPKRFSVSQLLDTWEMSVRQASAPVSTPVSANAILMGL